MCWPLETPSTPGRVQAESPTVPAGAQGNHPLAGERINGAGLSPRVSLNPLQALPHPELLPWCG